MSWARVRGHDRLVQSFQKVIRRGMLGHAYLFVGPEGVGFSVASCVAGGSAFVSGNDGKVYRLEGGSWKQIATQKVARFVHRLVPGDKGKLLVVGGAAHEGNARLVEEIAIPAGN